MIKNTLEIIKQQFRKGLNTSKNFFSLEEGQSPACINVTFNNDNSVSKRWGSSTMNTVVLESTGGYGMYDFGVLSSGIDSYTKLLLHCDGIDGSTTFTDSASPPKTVTANSGAQVDTAQSKFGGASGLFTGTGAFLSVPDHADWNFGSEDWTIDEWVRFNILPTGEGANQYAVIFAQRQNGFEYTGLSIRDNGVGVLALEYNLVSAGGNINIAKNVSPTLVINQWYHFTVVRNGNNWYHFQDGVQLGSTTVNSSNVQDFAAPATIGRFDDVTPSYFLNGWLDEFRVSKGLPRWTANFTPPAEAYQSNLIQTRRLLCASGTGIYYSSNVGKTWALAQTSRAATINYFGFVKDYVINTNESYEPPQYWAGTAGNYFVTISTLAPACKHSLSHQGFCILLNESANKTSMYYVDQNNMFTSAFSNFKLPTDRNDELTAGFYLGRNLYISSKYKIFRLSYIGGNPDWEYIEVRGFGFIPKTVKKIHLTGGVEAVIGLDWTKKLRLFTGAEDEIISDNIQKDNGITPFYLDNIEGLNLNKCWAEDDRKAQIYRLYLVYGGSTTISYALNFNYRTGAFYPEDNRPFQSGVLASDTADNLFMLACNYNGRIHILDSGNTEGITGINEYYISPFYYPQSPSRVHKSQQIDLDRKSTHL